MSGQAIAAERNLWCVRCDTRNPAGSLYCVGCGAPLGDAPVAPVAPPAQMAARRRCGVCGVGNPAGAVFCVNCGVPLAEPPAPGPRAYPPGLATATGGGTIVQHIYIAAPPAAEPPLFARALWFVFVGLWVGQIWLLLAWLLNLTLIGLPLGMWMLNRMPQVMTLRATRPRPAAPPIHSGASFVVRAVYFVLIGWWVSLLWMQLAWLAAATVIGLPLAFLMFERTSTVTTLAEA